MAQSRRQLGNRIHPCFALFRRLPWWFPVILTCFPLLAVELSIVDPVEGAFVSGPYEIVLRASASASIVQTRFFQNGEMVFETEGWSQRFTLDFGEEIQRHELFAVIVDDAGQSAHSKLVTTRELKVDYRETTRLILLGAVVKNRSNKPITGLTRDQFKVLENGRPLPIENFFKERLPLDLVLLLDTSSSLRKEGFPELKNAASLFVNKLSPPDRTLLYEFNNEPRRMMPFSTDRKRAIEHIEALRAHGHTALFDTIHLALAELEGRAKGRKAIVLFTDGEDTVYEQPHAKARQFRAAIDKAQNQEVTIFTIGLGGKIHRAALERLAEETGGRFYFAERGQSLPRVFSNILEDLKNQYMLGVRPSKGGAGFRRLEIKVAKRGAVVYSRKGYTQE